MVFVGRSLEIVGTLVLVEALLGTSGDDTAILTITPSANSGSVTNLAVVNVVVEKLLYRPLLALYFLGNQLAFFITAKIDIEALDSLLKVTMMTRLATDGREAEDDIVPWPTASRFRCAISDPTVFMRDDAGSSSCTSLMRNCGCWTLYLRFILCIVDQNGSTTNRICYKHKYSVLNAYANLLNYRCSSGCTGRLCEARR